MYNDLTVSTSGGHCRTSGLDGASSASVTPSVQSPAQEYEHFITSIQSMIDGVDLELKKRLQDPLPFFICSFTTVW